MISDALGVLALTMEPGALDGCKIHEIDKSRMTP